MRLWRTLGLLCLSIIAISPPLVHAAPPAWWTTRGVLDTTKQANDYAAVNQGQLKNMATQAAAELEAHLPGGMGDDVYNLVSSWSTPTAQSSDFAPVNLGMLKTIAQPFYDQLIEVGYTDAYPWNPDQSTINNYAAANIGQVKNLFSFDLTSATAANDLDGDGIADWWEEYYFYNTYFGGGFDPNALAARGGGLTILQAFQQGLDPNNVYNEESLGLYILSGNGQTGTPSTMLTSQLVVLVTNPYGVPLANIPVTFGFDSDGYSTTGILSPNADGSSPATSLSVLTDVNGQASVWFTTPSSAPAWTGVAVNLDPSASAQPVMFNEYTQSAVSASGLPMPPTDVTETDNADGSIDFTWVNVADDATCTTIRVRDQYGQWKVVGTVPPDRTSAHVNADGTLAQ